MVKRCLMSSPSAFACVAVSSETAVWCIKKRGVVEIRVGKQQIRVGKQQIRVGKGKIRVGTPAQVIFTPHTHPNSTGIKICRPSIFLGKRRKWLCCSVLVPSTISPHLSSVLHFRRKCGLAYGGSALCSKFFEAQI